MRQRTPLYLGIAGLCGAVLAAAVLPWAHYGGIDVRLSELSGWGVYVASAAVLQLFVIWVVLARPRYSSPALIGTALGVLTAIVSVVVLLHFDDARGIFGQFVPPIIPTIGMGGFLAIIATLASTAALATSIPVKTRRSSRRRAT